MGLKFKTRSFLVLVEIGFLFTLRNLVSHANFFVSCPEMFASSWVGKRKSGWGQRVQIEALEELVKSFRVSAGERVAVEALPSSESSL